MNRYLAIRGIFEEDGEKLVFKGDEIKNSDGISNPSFGILLFEDVLENGTIKMNIEFEELNEGEEAQILFNYNNENDFSCIGLSNSLFKYEYKSFKEEWNFHKMVGMTKLQAKTKYEIKVEIVGSTITLYVNNIKVIDMSSKNIKNKTHVGILTRSKNNIIISNFEVYSEKPKAFVVMQYGKNYDELYNDVIKAVCVEKGYEVVRADEITNSGLILNDIIYLIKNASLIIADITPDNPNVFYEVGYSHALNKPTILLNEKSSREKLPFDVSGFRTIFYSNSIGGKKVVEEKLNKFIDEISKTLKFSN